MKYLIDRYKEAKDWNTKQTGGNLQKTIFYDENDEVLGCRDAVTMKRVVHAGAVGGRDKESADTSKDVQAGSSERGEQEGSQINEREVTEKRAERGSGWKTTKTRNKAFLKI